MQTEGVADPVRNSLAQRFELRGIWHREPVARALAVHVTEQLPQARAEVESGVARLALRFDAPSLAGGLVDTREVDVLDLLRLEVAEAAFDRPLDEALARKLIPESVAHDSRRLHRHALWSTAFRGRLRAYRGQLLVRRFDFAELLDDAWVSGVLVDSHAVGPAAEVVQLRVDDAGPAVVGTGL